MTRTVRALAALALVIAFLTAGAALPGDGKSPGAADRLEIDVAPGIGHAVTPPQRQKAYAFFDRWLKGPPA
jgi:hypothetical protein